MRTNNRPAYYPIKVPRDPEVYRQLESTSKNLSRGGFCLGAIILGGYFLVKKVKDLNERVKELEKEAKKETR